MNPNIRQQIQVALKNIPTSNLRDASLALLQTLGYQSNKTVDLDGSPQAFLTQFESNASNPFNKDKALFDDWLEIQLLFQLTDEELGNQKLLFSDTEVHASQLKSYLFFAIKLSGTSYPRGKLAQLTRQLNRLFPMPVMVFFEYGEELSIAVINRRRHKRDDEKDVLGKVTLIQSISLRSPHRGHLDILASFSLPELAGKTGICDFDSLHAAWEEIFNVELLNKKFYRELSNWYFWAMDNVRFPFDDLELELDKRGLFPDKDRIREHDAKKIIRLLTRLLFVWFIKEKNLVPEEFFEASFLENKLLNQFSPDSKETIYYKAVLQNVFFASLNQTRGKREFSKGRQHFNVPSLLRYKSFFKAPEQFLEMVEQAIPFMNGGLFECSDKPDPDPTRKGPQGDPVIIREDGFSDNKKNILKFPDFLFFGKEQTIDLSKIYDDKKRKNEDVRGLIHILNSYKFTIMDNTPIEQEIALDPELLGKVFENLLASYNRETKTIARKQTESLYMPRTIVDYKVDESLKAYLKKAFGAAHPSVTEGGVDDGLNILFAHTAKEDAFSSEENAALIKILNAAEKLKSSKFDSVHLNKARDIEVLKSTEAFYTTANETKHTTRNQLLRPTSGNPDIFTDIANMSPATKKKTKNNSPKLKRFLYKESIPTLKKKCSYFHLDALWENIESHKIDCSQVTLIRYLVDMEAEDIIYDAGRGWYSFVKTPFQLDTDSLADLKSGIERMFPLLDFACWSTQQINSYMHHLLAKFVQFIFVDRDAMASVFGYLNDEGYDAYLNPTKREAEKIFSISKKTIVVRPTITKSPTQGHSASIEKILVDLSIEINALSLMDLSEFQGMFKNIATSQRLCISELVSYAQRRSVNLSDLSGENKSINSTFARKWS